ncbi:hypothetical protein A2U01_0093157, partial [Trifolium medium]|nr:hypothetical protein [Trifolium medium]
FRLGLFNLARGLISVQVASVAFGGLGCVSATSASLAVVVGGSVVAPV